ncbi:MAG: SagB/ThcOx family dehydrogenase [Bacteroidetes bacterium]|nr:SagB/ThcOx family dehydrogenase [Bacteroidota bacterium]MBU2585585.1 SagB/ThcOx family dehydrogenase [Bacteroidota bacterium]
MTKSKNYFLISFLILLGFVLIIILTLIPEKINSNSKSSEEKSLNTETVKLPQPSFKSSTSVEEAMLKRRSVRYFTDKPLTLSEISQLLWSAQGITEARGGLRAAPSAGALYPLEVYVVAGKVENLKAGIYKYKPQTHELIKIATGDKRTELYNAALQQSSIQTAPANLVFAAVYERTSRKYRERAERYVHMEIGHASQNVCLQAESLGLGTVTIGAFYDDKVKKAMHLPKNEEPLYIMPVGRKIE